MAAVARPPPPDKALTTEPALHDSPSHANMEPDPQAPRPVPFPRQSDADAPVGGGAGSGSKQPIESPPAPGSGAPSPPRSAASPAASVGHSAGGHTPGPLDESRYLEPTLPPQAGHPRRIKDDDLPPLPTSNPRCPCPTPASSGE
ncbi:uncharacterized protein B0H18DRAFT_108125 [Fomitopsis serialis]|uniref:uncharacterized protein n=1 Tax=Fomitopsis serialis TaxID=139415 RepID=UPI00200853EF|nr:uncharacterized protein B0H18DRAFT_108125 [Neoantrodia serialis]KAH9915109.1 hypothetical protein B0H18DRAFT_108125 [Neoantrodia serialis]